MNTQIEITQNGTTTLATAGKYCDRNIDVNVEVSGGGEDLVADLVQGTISGDYVSDKVTSLKPYAFALCNDLTSVALPNCTTFRYELSDTGSYFRYSEKLKAVNVPNLTTIENGGRAFGNCSALEEFNAPNLTYLKTTSTMFTTCRVLKKVSFPKLGGTTIDANTFANCYDLETLILGGDTLNPLANVNAFNNAGLSYTGMGKIYVPDNLVDTYKTATNWSTFADKIKPMSKYVEE